MEEEQQRLMMMSRQHSSATAATVAAADDESYKLVKPDQTAPAAISKDASPGPPDEQQLPESKALVLLNNPHLDGDPSASPTCSTISFTPGSLSRDIVLAKLNQEKVLSLIKAWEDNAKAKSLHRYNKKLAKISAWEKAKKAKAEAHLQMLEEKLEKKKASFVEGMQNKVAGIHMKAEEERALAEAFHGEETLKADEAATKYRASGKLPKSFALCFGI